MGHQVFIQHTYIYKCSDKACTEEWKINEAADIEKLRCPHCGKYDNVEYILDGQFLNYNKQRE
jgi:hypothetical protein